MDSSTYRKNYDKGWNASGGNGKDGPGLQDAGERFVRRHGVTMDGPEYNAWLDGWLDWSGARDKYHFETCDGDCGQH